MMRYAVFLLALSLTGQWLDLPTPGIPRTADRKPDLKAPAPRTPRALRIIEVSRQGRRKGAISVECESDLSLGSDRVQARIKVEVGDNHIRIGNGRAGRCTNIPPFRAISTLPGRVIPNYLLSKRASKGAISDRDFFSLPCSTSVARYGSHSF